MNINTETKTKEEDIEGSSLEESLDKELLHIFDFMQAENYYARINPEIILREAYQQGHRVRKDNLDEKDFHKVYETMKNSLGNYFAASVCMAMLYAIMAVRKDQKYNTLSLMCKIENRYRLRPWMKEVTQLVYHVKYIIPKNIDIPINMKFEDVRTLTERKGVNITLNINKGIIRDIQHADIHVETPGNFIENQITTK